MPAGACDHRAVERECRGAAGDEVELLVAGGLLGVGLDDVVAGRLRHVGVGAERAEPSSWRTGSQRSEPGPGRGSTESSEVHALALLRQRKTQPE